MKFVIATVLVFFSLFANAQIKRGEAFVVAAAEEGSAQAAIIQVLKEEVLSREWDQDVEKTYEKLSLTYIGDAPKTGIRIVMERVDSRMTSFIVIGSGTEGMMIQRLIIANVKRNVRTFQTVAKLP